MTAPSQPSELTSRPAGQSFGAAPLLAGQPLTIINGDCRSALRALPDQSVNCCVTSPPYWGLRNYNHTDQIGQEETSEAFVQTMRQVFSEVWRVLRDDGTLWLNLGDTYEGKSLSGVPWRVALALKSDGWQLRSDIIWHKPNPMPEPLGIRRPTKAHEYLFMFAKAEKYYWDEAAVQERKECWRKRGHGRSKQNGDRNDNGEMAHFANKDIERGTRNKRDVWTVPTFSFKGAHFATYPPDLIRPCIVAGCPADGVVLDPFGGSGTTGQVALEAGRRAVLVELNPDYVKLCNERCSTTRGLPLAC